MRHSGVSTLLHAAIARSCDSTLRGIAQDLKSRLCCITQSFFYIIFATTSHYATQREIKFDFFRLSSMPHRAEFQLLAMRNQCVKFFSQWSGLQFHWRGRALAGKITNHYLSGLR
jgi:hypothetical protein